MKFDVYVPEGFKTWIEYRKYQHLSDVIAGLVLTFLAIATLIIL